MQQPGISISFSRGVGELVIPVTGSVLSVHHEGMEGLCLRCYELMQGAESLPAIHYLGITDVPEPRIRIEFDPSLATSEKVVGWAVRHGIAGVA